MRKVVTALMAAAGAAAGYWLILTGRLTADLKWCRRLRPLGPLGVEVEAQVDTVFDVISEPYLGRTPRALAAKLRVVERGEGMVLAEHYTRVWPGLNALTVETVVFERPRRVSFRLVRGPVPYVREQFALDDVGGSTIVEYSGELGTDLGVAGSWWGQLVARQWEQTVRTSMDSIKAEAERRTRAKRHAAAGN